LLGHSAGNISEMGGENIGNARQKMQSQGQRARGNDKVGVNNIRLPDTAYIPSWEKCGEKVKRHFCYRAGVLASSKGLRAENSDSIDLGLGRKMAETCGHDAHLVAVAHKPFGYGRCHASPTPAYRGVFVAEDEDFHGRKRS
jgi:hypothetical protein